MEGEIRGKRSADRKQNVGGGERRWRRGLKSVKTQLAGQCIEDFHDRRSVDELAELAKNKAECIEHRVSENRLVFGQNSEKFSGERGTCLSNAWDYPRVISQTLWPNSPTIETSKWTPVKQAKLAKSVQSLSLSPNHRAEQFPDNLYASGYTLYCQCQLET